MVNHVNTIIFICTIDNQDAKIKRSNYSQHSKHKKKQQPTYSVKRAIWSMIHTLHWSLVNKLMIIVFAYGIFVPIHFFLYQCDKKIRAREYVRWLRLYGFNIYTTWPQSINNKKLQANTTPTNCIDWINMNQTYRVSDFYFSSSSVSPLVFLQLFFISNNI